ncbi:MAG: hypothetical protein HC905_10680 [Bacteroidales bacterium]|nr:hypothetical protein [Bacteroidales bacterium]
MKRSNTFKIVLKQVGSLLILLGFVVAIPAIIAAIYTEWYSVAGFLLSALIIMGTGLLLFKGFYHVEEPRFNHSLIIAATGWLGIAILGGLPFLIIAFITPVDVMNQFIPNDVTYTFSSLVYFRNPLHCFFESMSAYTTTGLSMAVHEPSVGKGVLFIAISPNGSAVQGL